MSFLFCHAALAVGAQLIALDTLLCKPGVITTRCIRELEAILVLSQNTNRVFGHVLGVMGMAISVVLPICTFVIFEKPGLVLVLLLIWGCFAFIVVIMYPIFFVNQLLMNRLEKIKTRIYSESATRLLSTRVAFKLDRILKSEIGFTFFSILRYNRQSFFEVSKK